MENTVSLKENYQFLKVYKKGFSCVGKYLIIYCIKNNRKKIRLGITTSKKVGNSVVRNRIRRLVRENYRLMEKSLLTGFDIVFVVRSSEKIPDYYEIKKEMKFLFKKLGILNQER